MALNNNNNKNSLITNPYICTARLEKFKITHSTYKIYREPHKPMNLWGSLQRVITGSLWDLVHNLILETPSGAESTDILVGKGILKSIFICWAASLHRGFSGISETGRRIKVTCSFPEG